MKMVIDCSELIFHEPEVKAILGDKKVVLGNTIKAAIDYHDSKLQVYESAGLVSSYHKERKEFLQKALEEVLFSGEITIQDLPRVKTIQSNFQAIKL